MFGSSSRIPSSVALVGAALGLSFAWTSTADYASHLDRKLHDLHCSFVPGAAPTDDAEACRAAMYSPYAAFLKQDYWGGVPISLFAIGAFAFFAAFAIYLVLAAERAPKKAVVFFAATSVTPLLTSAVMFVISLTELGSFCKTCVGIYGASFVLALGGLATLATLRSSAPSPGPAGTIPGQPWEAPVRAPDGRPSVSALLPLAWLAVLGVTTLVPAVAYTASLPDHSAHLRTCGTLGKAEDEHGALLSLPGPRALVPVTLFEDPLCPTCKAFHERLVTEGIYAKLDVTLAMFPLDDECNWMLDRALHPGACLLSRAVLCADGRALDVLEWAYREQDALAAAGRNGPAALEDRVRARWGDDLVKCAGSKKAKQRLNRHLHFATDNSIPVSTPQMFVGNIRVCEEDTDIGLVYTLGHLAPELRR